ncbi:MAG: hypothetical protein M0C28_37685 [Candidatus Moduliflexus flocculans]|nr:hypothetical protein [Candidatus Moduliflexus flocculans]
MGQSAAQQWLAANPGETEPRGHPRLRQVPPRGSPAHHPLLGGRQGRRSQRRARDPAQRPGRHHQVHGDHPGHPPGPSRG